MVFYSWNSSSKTYLDKKNKILIKLLGDPDQALIVNVTNGQINK